QVSGERLVGAAHAKAAGYRGVPEHFRIHLPGQIELRIDSSRLARGGGIKRGGVAGECRSAAEKVGESKGRKITPLRVTLVVLIFVTAQPHRRLPALGKLERCLAKQRVLGNGLGHVIDVDVADSCSKN